MGGDRAVVEEHRRADHYGSISVSRAACGVCVGNCVALQTSVLDDLSRSAPLKFINPLNGIRLQQPPKNADFRHLRNFIRNVKCPDLSYFKTRF